MRDGGAAASFVLEDWRGHVEECAAIRIKRVASAVLRPNGTNRQLLPVSFATEKSPEPFGYWTPRPLDGGEAGLGTRPSTLSGGGTISLIRKRGGQDGSLKPLRLHLSDKS